MKNRFIICLVIFPFLLHAQKDTAIFKVKGSGSMSDLQMLISPKEKSVARFAFRTDKDMILDIFMMESVSNTDSLFERVLFRDSLKTKKQQRVYLSIEQDGANVNIGIAYAGNFLAITPVKSQEKNMIQPFMFKSKPMVEEKNVPIMLIVDNDKKFSDAALSDLLSVQDMSYFQYHIVRDLKKKVGKFKILSYYLKSLP